MNFAPSRSVAKRSTVVEPMRTIPCARSRADGFVESGGMISVFSLVTVKAYAAAMMLAITTATMKLMMLVCVSTASLEDIARDIRTKHSMKGLVIAMVTKDGVVEIAADGVRAEGASDAIMTTDRMHLGSCTKAFTATLAATFVAEGALQWNSTVGDVLGAQSATMHADWKAVTLEELLRHRGGAPGSPDAAAWSAAWKCEATPKECRIAFTDAILAKPLAQPRGTQMYSNQGYAIAGRMCEAAHTAASSANANYETLLAERVLAPLGIVHYGFGAPSLVDAASPKGHSASGAKSDVDNPQSIAPAATLHMPVGEWAKFIAFQLGGTAPKDLEGAAKQLAYLHKPWEKLGEKSGETTRREALGWFVLDRPWGGRVLTHSGSNTVWYCSAWIAPEKGFAVLAATNQGGDAMAKVCDEACSAMIQLRK